MAKNDKDKDPSLAGARARASAASDNAEISAYNEQKSYPTVLNKPDDSEVILNKPDDTEYKLNKLNDSKVYKKGGKVKKKQVKIEGNKSRHRLDRKMPKK